MAKLYNKKIKTLELSWHITGEIKLLNVITNISRWETVTRKLFTINIIRPKHDSEYHTNNVNLIIYLTIIISENNNLQI